MVTRHENGMVEFAYYRPGARSVGLTGDFNEWESGGRGMRMDGEGWWRARLMLREGEYRFNYVVDGVLREADFAAFGVEGCGDGEWRSVVVVEGIAEKVGVKAA